MEQQPVLVAPLYDSKDQLLLLGVDLAMEAVALVVVVAVQMESHDQDLAVVRSVVEEHQTIVVDVMAVVVAVVVVLVGFHDSMVLQLVVVDGLVT